MKILVIGGVAGGMSAAARARRLNEKAEIVVLERGQHVSFANCGLPYHIAGAIKDREQLLLQTPESLRAMLNLDVRVGHEATAIDRQLKHVTVKEVESGKTYTEAYDKLVLSPGAGPIVPDLPGIDHPKIFTLRNVTDMDLILSAMDDSVQNAVVIGGGYIGIEMAEALHARRMGVDLVEMADQIMPPLDREMTRDLESHMRWKGVRLHLGAAAAAFRGVGNSIQVELVNGTTLKGDLVVLAVGVKPETSLARDAGLELGARGGIRVDAHLRTSDPDIYAAGDAVEVIDAVTGKPAQIPLAGPANRQGRAAGDNVLGGDSTYTGTQGTAVVKVFDMTAGGTGASERTLKSTGTDYRKVYLHPSGHAGYYPGTAPMHVKVLFSPDDGRLLGAQVVGFDGVDKRLDVFATALSAGMTVHDLQNLELSYAPPYGSAKDPVNMAGFVGSNLLKGDIELWYAEDYPDKTGQGLILDVRTPTEFETWHLPGAENIPVQELRKRLDELDPRTPIFTYCKVGFRSYLAYRLLKQSGFEKVATLAGGTMTFCAHHGTGICKGQPEPPVVSYAEDKALTPPEPTGSKVELDLRGLQCPGPIRKLAEAFNAAAPGDEITALASDQGFASDVPAWCKRQGHTVLDIRQDGPTIRATLRKGSKAARDPLPTTCANASTDKNTMVVFSGDLDKVTAAFIIANGAATMGSDVTMFFTFWGLNALRQRGPQAAGKSILDWMFGWMMPKGPTALKLSQMHMLGAGTALMKHVMRSKNVDSLPELVRAAQEAGVKLVACTMSMDVMGIKKEELIDNVEFGGVAAFLGESEDAGMTLFI